MAKKYQKRLDRLDRKLDDLFRELESYSPEHLNRNPAPGKWSALQVMHHLMLSEKGSHQYLEKKLSFDPKLKKAGMQTALRSVLLDLFFRAPLKFNAPEIVSDNALPDQSSLGEVAAQWRRQREELRKFLAGLPEEVFDKEAFRHPFIGRLTVNGMIRFLEGHFDRHRKQIGRAVNSGR